MHTVGMHSALAINRQRKRREEMKRHRERRYSSQSTESGIGGSSCGSPGSFGGSMDRLGNSRKKAKKPSSGLMNSKVVPPIGMLHIGIVFVVLGLFLIGSGIIPDDYTAWDQSINWWNELVCSGTFALAIGVFLISLNHYLSQQEEDELSAYVERQLTRSRSGKRLIKDEETGGMKTKHEKRTAREPPAALAALDISAETDLPSTSYAFSPTLKSPPPVTISSPKTDLEKILEEDISEERGDEEYGNMETFNKNTMANGSVSPNVHHHHHQQQQQQHHHQPQQHHHQYQEAARELVVTRYYHTEQQY